MKKKGTISSRVLIAFVIMSVGIAVLVIAMEGSVLGIHENAVEKVINN